MPRQSPHIVDDILQYTLVAANALQDLAAATGVPFLRSVSGLCKNTRLQKDRCLHILEEIHRFLCALMGLSLHSENIRSPEMLDKIAEYAITLHKIDACLRVQQDLGKIKRLFKQSEITAQLNMQYGSGVASALVELNADTERRHQELLELISARSGSFDIASSVVLSPSYLLNPNITPLDPGKFVQWQIFHGREVELNHLVGILMSEPARAAVMGPGGMGKTTLAMAALHDAAIAEKYAIRHFISCESANTSADVVSTIGSHLGMEPSRQLSKEIVQHFLECDVPTLALLITMRGAERPAKIKWNRPFLPPLEPLPLSASRQIFSEVADEPTIEEESTLDELLDLSGSLPLAVSLMANIVSFEGYGATLSRWRVENTTLLSDGHDKSSNLEKSILLSLGSPRISSSPHARELLSLLSLLPDGITDMDILISKVPIMDIAQCRSSLVRTSLAYNDLNGRLKVLSPIREYMRNFFPPSPSLFRPLRIYFQGLLRVWESRHQLSPADLVPGIVINLGNINVLILHDLLTANKSEYSDIAGSIMKLDYFSKLMLKGSSPLMQKLPHLVEQTENLQLRWSYVNYCLKDYGPSAMASDGEALINHGIESFKENSPVVEAIMFYNAAGHLLFQPE
ncbi:hypothetical protein DFH09DRAFT_1406410 [Mycena vulgaris]|nr:hypothetical protein DFH09DRAFT_1406410 [Mycena vulgaris]